MEKAVAAIYKKIKLKENFYVFRFKGIVRNPEIEYDDYTISFIKDGKKITLFEMEEPAFIVSDEKICYSDYIELESLKEMYNIDDEESVIDIFEEECKSFLRFVEFDEEKEVVKIINSDITDIEEAKPDTKFCDFGLEYVSETEKEFALPSEVIYAIHDDLKDGNYKDAYERVKTIIEVEEFYSDVAEEMLENDKKEENKVEKKEDVKEIDTGNLDELIGLDNIKKEIIKLKNYLSFLNKTKEELSLDNPNLHMVFSGNPGTGKTTVARILAKLLFDLGYVKNNKFKEITAGDLIAGYVGQTATKTKDVLSKNRGGVIFIDEAYVFCSKGQEFANEALVEIIKEMEKKETIFIFAGYTKEMKEFVDMNPGIKSRVGYSLEFEDYTVEQLYQIFEYKLSKTKLQITDEGKEKVKALIAKCVKVPNFGNGRFIDKLFDKIIVNHACKTVTSSIKDELITIQSDSIDEDILDTIKGKEKVKIKIGFEG